MNGSSFEETEIQYGTMSNPLTIGGLHFENIGVGVHDLSFLKPLEENFTDGTKLYGITFTNIMRKAFWRINYTEKNITISNDINNLISDANITKIDMNSKNTDNWGANTIQVTLMVFPATFF